MGFILDAITWVKANGVDLLAIYAAIIGAASILVKLTPTTKDDAFLEKIKAFVAKYIALN